MTIIIETPQPPVREAITITRLHKSMLRPAYSTKPVEKEVLDPSTTRDATPADLERAGWVPRAALDTQVEATLSNIRRAGHLERERDEARAERDKLDAKLAQAEERGDLADRRAIDAIAERDELARGIQFAHLALGSPHGADLATQCGTVVRERDEARRERDNYRANYGDVCAELEARREYNELVGRGLEEIGKVTEAARAAGWNGSDNPKAVWDFIAHLAAERNEARAALSAMGLLAHRRDTDGPSAPEPAGRATDEELAEAYRAAYGDPDAPQEEKHEVAHARALRAVAERVRREDLIARCVEAGLDLAVVEAHDDAERAPGLWYIVRITESGGEETEATVPAADVPATVARLLVEVTR